MNGRRLASLRSVFTPWRLSVGAVVCAAVAVAATTAVLTLVLATVVRPLPFPAADRLVRLWWDETGVNSRTSLAIPELAELAAVDSFERVLGTARRRLVALFPAGAERMRGEAVSPLYFETLGIGPRLGRIFDERDHASGAERVAILSHSTWLNRFAADPAVVGQMLRSELEGYRVIGVLPAGFQGTVEDDVVEFWVPLAHYRPAVAHTDRGFRSSWAIALLRPGAALASAQARLDALSAGLAAEHGGFYSRARLRIEPLGENWREGFRRSGSLLLGAAATILLVAALNIGGLLVARAGERQRDLAVRAALGAPPGRLARRLLAEAGILVGLGGTIGAFTSPWVLSGLLELSPVALPAYVSLRPDAVVTLGALAAILVTGLVAGALPALVARRASPAELLVGGGRGSVGSRGGRGERRWQDSLVAVEVALTLVLLVAGGLLLRAYRSLTSQELGFRVEGVVRLAVTASPSDTGAETTALPAFYQRLADDLAAQPSVESVGLVSPTLPPWDGYRPRIRAAGLPEPFTHEGFVAGAHAVDPGLFATMEIDLVAGRGIGPGDGIDAPRVAVVSRSVAELLGGVDFALGREILLPEEDDGPARGPARIVGVARDVRWDGVRDSDTSRYILYGDPADGRGASFDVYTSLAQSGQAVVSIAVSTPGDAAALLAALRRRLASFAPHSAVHWTETMEEGFSGEVATSRFYLVLVSAFSTSALVLMTAGLFALFSNLVASRIPELGLRMALGSTRRGIALLVLRRGLRPLAWGLGAGLTAAFVLGRGLRHLLYDVGVHDPQAFAGAALLMTAVAIAAGVFPTRRATRVDPLIALRGDAGR